MMDPTFLSESWLDKDAGTHVAPAYFTPAIIRRMNDAQGQPDHGMQMTITPEGNGLFALNRLDFTLPHHDRVRTADETTIQIATGLNAADAITRAYALMGQEFETAKGRRDSVPQAIKVTRPTSITGAEPLAKLPATLPPAEQAGAEATLQRLSSQWGKKTSLFGDLPRLKRPEIGPFSF